MDINYDTKYDVIVVGAGPGGLAATYYLANAGMNVLLIEKGMDINTRHCPAIEHNIKCPKCRPVCDLISGFGGAGLYSDGKIVLSDKVGGDLDVEESEYNAFMQFIAKFYPEFEIKEPENTEYIKRLATEAGMEYIPERIIHLGTDGSLVMLRNVYDWMADNENITMMFGTEVKWFKKIDGEYVVVTRNNHYMTKHLIISPGRDGSIWLSDQLGNSNDTLAIDVGVRIETSTDLFDDFKELHEIKLVYHTPSFNDKIRTFCMNPNGYVIQEYTHDHVTVNGFSYSDPEMVSGRTNLALLVSVNFTHPFKNAYEYGLSILKLTNQLANGTVLVQRYGDLKRFRRSTYERLSKNEIQPTLEPAEPGDLSFAMPHRILVDVIEFIEALNKVFPGINSDSTLLYGSEIKFYTANKNTSEPYVAGDGSGKTRGIFQAFISGYKIASKILQKESS